MTSTTRGLSGRGAARLALLAFALVICGCECGSSHELPDGGAQDSAIVEDAPDARVPGDRFFTLELGSAVVIDERCAATEGASAPLRVTVRLLDSCDTPGPVLVDVDAAARAVHVRALVWREHGRDDCTPIDTRYERDVLATGLTEGTWSVDFPGGSSSLVVDARSPVACTLEAPIAAGGSCHVDCDCEADLACVAIRGDAVCDMRCEPSCELESPGRELGLGCAPEHACVDDATVGALCTPRTADSCGVAEPCPGGMQCVTDGDAASYCAWAIELTGANRHACTVSSECDVGLDCVHHADGSARCEVRCNAVGMRCPGAAPHACDARGVCEWLGE